MQQRTVLITGANRGLGFETCRQLARAGDRVILTSRDPRKGESALARLAEEGLRATALTCDATEPASWKALADRLAFDRVKIDVLIHNAGVALEGFDADVAQRTLDVNFFAVLGITDVLLPRIALGGDVLIVSSGVGELAALGRGPVEKLEDEFLDRQELIDLMDSFVEDVGLGRHAQVGWPSSAYRVSKAGVNALARVLARELSERRIAVNAVCPGWVRTDMGGASAERSVEEGARSIVAATKLAGKPTGGFFRDGQKIPW